LSARNVPGFSLPMSTTNRPAVLTAGMSSLYRQARRAVRRRPARSAATSFPSRKPPRRLVIRRSGSAGFQAMAATTAGCDADVLDLCKGPSLKSPAPSPCEPQAGRRLRLVRSNCRAVLKSPLPAPLALN
jgi:hypothetical protein